MNTRTLRITTTAALSLKRPGGQFVTPDDIRNLGNRSLVLERGAVLYAQQIGATRRLFVTL